MSNKTFVENKRLAIKVVAIIVFLLLIKDITLAKDKNDFKNFIPIDQQNIIIDLSKRLQKNPAFDARLIAGTFVGVAGMKPIFTIQNTASLEIYDSINRPSDVPNGVGFIELNEKGIETAFPDGDYSSNVVYLINTDISLTGREAIISLGMILEAKTPFVQPPIVRTKYRVTVGPSGSFGKNAGGRIYWVSPSELMANYHKIRNEAKCIERLAKNEKHAVVFLTPDPTNAEVQQRRDNDHSYIYSLQDFSDKMLNPSIKIYPIGETRTLRDTKIRGSSARVVERFLYKNGKREERINDGSSLTWWFPVSPP